ncbi:MAG: hypothetical protein D6719_12880 [Candidatus Dadabacteria bacterium]|nr:MAG: hypothetical protein D6719_12880 [Candidatus Dadabacteria bacterium]
MAGRLVAQSRHQLEPLFVDPFGEAELVVCSQNLDNYGLYNDTKIRNRKISFPEDYEAKEAALLRRFVKNKCDVIALQEIIAKDIETGKKVLKQLARGLKVRTNRIFDIRVAPSNDKMIRVGYLVARDRASIAGTLSYARVELPKLTPDEKQRDFSRGPYEIQLHVKPKGDSYPKTVVLVTFHFKSKRGGKGDPARLEYETYRMEMAEALRRVVEGRHSAAFTVGEKILVVLGDRNSHFDSASARILEGRLTLAHFQKGGVCRLSKRGVPLCQSGAQVAARLFSVLTRDPQLRSVPGTIKYRGVYSWIDDILMPAESLRFARVEPNKEGDYDSGVDFSYEKASDHALVWVRLNW